MIWIVWFILCVLIGVWANKKGRSGAGYFLLSLVLSPLIGALIVAVLSPVISNIEADALKGGDVKRCPSCAELIKREAVKCRFCGTEQPPPPPPAPDDGVWA